MENSQKEELELYIAEKYNNEFVVVPRKDIETEKSVFEGKVCSSIIYGKTGEGELHRIKAVTLRGAYSRLHIFDEDKISKMFSDGEKWGNKTTAAREGKVR